MFDDILFILSFSYGLSAGLPGVSHTLADAEAAYDYLVATYPVESQRIIVYGQSLGSGPTTHLSRHRRVNGVVIHSGIMSALRVLDHTTSSTRWFDIYPNIDLINKTPAPVFVIHGTEDKEIPLPHGQGLAGKALVKFKPWWVEVSARSIKHTTAHRQTTREQSLIGSADIYSACIIVCSVRRVLCRGVGCRSQQHRG